jgi:chromosome segregation ATPase
MNKIANTQELQAELRTLLAYSETPNPSREKIASALESLSERVASRPYEDIASWKQNRARLESSLNNAQTIFLGLADMKNDLNDRIIGPNEAKPLLNTAVKTIQKIDGAFGAFRDQVDNMLGEYTKLVNSPSSELHMAATPKTVLDFDKKEGTKILNLWVKAQRSLSEAEEARKALGDAIESLGWRYSGSTPRGTSVRDMLIACSTARGLINKVAEEITPIVEEAKKFRDAGFPEIT